MPCCLVTSLRAEYEDTVLFNSNQPCGSWFAKDQSTLGCALPTPCMLTFILFNEIRTVSQVFMSPLCRVFHNLYVIPILVRVLPKCVCGGGEGFHTSLLLSELLLLLSRGKLRNTQNYQNRARA